MVCESETCHWNSPLPNSSLQITTWVRDKVHGYVVLSIVKSAERERPIVVLSLVNMKYGGSSLGGFSPSSPRITRRAVDIVPQTNFRSGFSNCCNCICCRFSCCCCCRCLLFVVVV